MWAAKLPDVTCQGTDYVRILGALQGVALAMILTCPSCRTRYQAENARFVPPGRNVRCAKCGQVWFQSAPEPEPQSELEQVLASPDTPTPVLGEVAPDTAALPGMASLDFATSRTQTVIVTRPRSPKLRRAKMPPLSQVTGWAALILMVLAIGWSAVQFRQTIANLWPQSTSLYAALGMPVNVRGMALVNVSYQQDFEDGQPVLSVTGKVVNISDRELAVPELHVVLTDDSKRELYQWTFDVGVPTLKAGAESPFITRLSSPPPQARNLNIRFAEIGEAQ
jgi:predicted Zn finger-like uncharacterized protein